MKNSIKYIILAILFVLFLSCAETEEILEGSYSTYGETGIIAGMSFPPFSSSDQIDFTIEEIEKLAIDRIRIAIDWRNREPSEGNFYWDPMDVRMFAAEDNDISVFLTIASVCPDWAALPSGIDGACFFNEDAFKTFIDSLLIRYPHIDKIQFGNEWEAGNEDGTAYKDHASIEKFVTYNNILFDAVADLSPETKVVLGGITRTFPIVEYFANESNYPDFSGLELANGVTNEYLINKVDNIKIDYDTEGIRQNIDYVFEEARYDMIDIHLYDDPENWQEYLSVLPTNKPILVSEFGGPNSEFENTAPDYQAKRMEDYIDAIEALLIIEAYYFKLVESDASYHQDSGLFYDNLKIKPARNVFARRLTPQE